MENLPGKFALKLDICTQILRSAEKTISVGGRWTDKVVFCHKSGNVGKTMSKVGKIDITLRRKTENITGEINHYFSHSLYIQSVPWTS